MIRTLLEQHIERYLDDGLPLPGWLVTLVRRDDRLRQFIDRHQALDDALLLSAAERRDALTPHAPLPEFKRPRLRAAHREPATVWLPRRQWAYFLAGAAAALLVALFIDQQRREADAAKIQALAQQLADVRGEMSSLVTNIASTAQSNLPRYSPAVILRHQSDAWRSRAQEVIEPLDRQTQAVGVWLTKYSDLGQRVRSRLEADLMRDKSS